MSILSTPPRLQESLAPSVALIIPVYNAEPYLQDCLDSVFSQNYSNFTVFAVDDGSVDQSGALLDAYAKKDSRLHVLHTPNRGFSAARNAALELIESCGSWDYIAFTDSDDKVTEDMLKKLVTESQTNQSDIVCCAFSKFDETGNNYTEGELFQPHRLSRENFLSLLLADGRYKKLCGRGGMVWKCLYRASCIHGLRFDEDRNICEDELFNTQAALHADIITYIPEVLYFYRVRRHLTAPSAQWDLKLAEGRLRAFGIAQKISEEAALLLGAAYIKTILSLAKKTRNQPPVPVKISSSWIEKIVASKLLDPKKNFLWFLLSRHPRLFSLYCSLRPNRKA